MKRLLFTIFLGLFFSLAFGQIEFKRTLSGDTLTTEKTVTTVTIKEEPLSFYDLEMTRVESEIKRLTAYKARLEKIAKDYAPVLYGTPVQAATEAKEHGLRFYKYKGEVFELVK